LTLREAVAVIEQAALGVGHAHKQQVIHRDLKPHNIMVTEVDGNEYVKVLDFGLVKALEQEEDEHLTSTGQVLGTPQYMPPEQAGGEPVDQRSDLYALTAVFYYCLTGNSPYGANTVRKALTAALTQQVPTVATYRSGAPVPDAIDRFMKRGLAAEKEDRFQDTDEFIAAMHAAIGGLSDAVLDAVPTYIAEASAKDGSGSSGASKKANASRSRPASKAASAVSRPLPKSSSRVEVAPSLAAEGTPAPPAAGSPVAVIVGAVVLGLAIIGAAVGYKLTQRPEAVVAPRVTVTSPLTEPVKPATITVKVTLTTQPAGAEVVEDGSMLGKTPLSIDWVKGTARTLTLRAEGFKELTKSLRPEAEQTLDFALEAVAPHPTPAQPQKPKPPKKGPEDIGAFE
jgi:serine/threonine-protein kinase